MRACMRGTHVDVVGMEHGPEGESRMGGVVPLKNMAQAKQQTRADGSGDARDEALPVELHQKVLGRDL